jgi:hypothetical protein
LLQLIFSLNFHLIYNVALYRKAFPEGRTSWIGEDLLAEEMTAFLVSNASLNANGNSPPWVCSSACVATAIVHNVRKFSWQQKKDLNATERMHAHFCMNLRRIG